MILNSLYLIIVIVIHISVECLSITDWSVVCLDHVFMLSVHRVCAWSNNCELSLLECSWLCNELVTYILNEHSHFSAPFVSVTFSLHTSLKQMNKIRTNHVVVHSKIHQRYFHRRILSSEIFHQANDVSSLDSFSRKRHSLQKSLLSDNNNIFVHAYLHCIVNFLTMNPCSIFHLNNVSTIYSPSECFYQ